MGSVDLPKVREQSVVPMYHQIGEILREKIRLAQYRLGERIPSETELQRHFGVSRATIRKALDSLVVAGVLERRQGSGTYVVEPKIDELLSHLVSFTEEMLLKGMTPSTKRVAAGLVEAPRRLVATLQVAPGQKLLRVERLKCANDQPVAILDAYLAPWLSLSPDDDFSGSLYEVLEKKCGIRVATGDQVIEAKAAAEHEARLLEIRRGDPVLVIRRTEYEEGGRPFDHVVGTYRADRYSYRIQLHRKYWGR